MSGNVPDVRGADKTDDRRHDDSTHGEKTMTLIQVKVIERVFTAAQKQDIIERLTAAMATLDGDNTRQHIWCIVEEVGSGDWGVDGDVLTADDARALGNG
jgi:4-oxalocrotonate tautomerase